jgi:hypothetical protein
VVVADFDDEHRFRRMPNLLLTTLIPTAGPARRRTGESRWGDELFEFLCHGPTVAGGNARGKAHMMQQTIRIVETKKKGTD